MLSPCPDFIFDHEPIVGGIVRSSDCHHTFEWKEEIDRMPLNRLQSLEEIFSKKPIARADGTMPSDEEWRLFQYRMFMGCLFGTNPFVSVARTLRRLLDKSIKYTNAFAKMYEMCFVPEIRSIFDAAGREGNELSIACLAEAPGFFLVAIYYYFGTKFPRYLDDNRIHTTLTTLPFEGSSSISGEEKTESPAALTDQFSLIARNKSNWYFMDHTSVEEIRKMITDLGAASRDLVTGDIGKPSEFRSDREIGIYREDLGQFISACALLRDGGASILKMFSTTEYSTACILRLAIGLFEKTRVFKPFTSHLPGPEVYWIMTGFKKNLFDAMLDDLLSVLADANALLTSTSAPSSGEADDVGHMSMRDIIGGGLTPYPGFLDFKTNFHPDLIDKFYHLALNHHIRSHAFIRMAVSEFASRIDRFDEPYAAQIDVIKAYSSFARPYLDQWLYMFPISRMRDQIQRLIGPND